MNRNDIRIIQAVAFGAAVVILSAREYIRIHREEQAKREQIDRDMHLDIAAIHKASPVILARIDAGEIRSLAALQDAVKTETAFQKIAIREED
jgi:hypothetical protein